MTVAEEKSLQYLLAQPLVASTTQEERKTIVDSWLEGYVSGVKLKFQRQVAKNSSVALMVIIPADVDQAVEDVRPDEQRVETDDPQVNFHFFKGWATGQSIGDGNIALSSVEQ